MDHVISREIREVLSTLEAPFTVEELAAVVYARCVGHVYSPRERYAVGQRLYHPAVGVWFTVVEIVAPNSMKVLFDDGFSIKLLHDSKEYRRDLLNPADLMTRIKELVQQQLASSQHFARHDGVYRPMRRVPAPAAARSRSTDLHAELARLEARKSTSEYRALFDRLCQDLGIKHLYYLTPLENLPSILDKGLMPKNMAPPEASSFADPAIQAKRHERRPNPSLRLTLHDYVPLFFAPKPPLLFKVADSHTMVYLLVSPRVLLRGGVVFSATNAAVGNPVYYTDLRDLARLDWDVLHAEYWASDDEAKYKQNKAHRQAEAEIPLNVPVEYVEAIVARDPATGRQIWEALRERNLPIAVRVYKGLFPR